MLTGMNMALNSQILDIDVSERKCAVICPDCWNTLGHADITRYNFVDIKSWDLSEASIEKIYDQMNVVIDPVMDCPFCKKKSNKLLIDEKLEEIIIYLNKELGIKTTFCCQGHYKLSEPYIVFKDYITMRKTRLFSIEHTGNAELGESILRVNTNKLTVEEWENYSWVEDLTTIIHTHGLTIKTNKK